jgi:hypothetical protein
MGAMPELSQRRRLLVLAICCTSLLVVSAALMPGVGSATRY